MSPFLIAIIFGKKFNIWLSSHFWFNGAT